MTETDMMRSGEALEIIRMSGMLPQKPRIGIHSPWPAQTEQVKKLFPESELTVYDINSWNIMTGPSPKGHDLLIFQNVFHYIAEPYQAFMNCIHSCQYLLIQDRIIRDRSKNGIFCETDGDCMRYSIGPVKSNLPGAFDLSALKDYTVFCYPYLDDGRFIHVLGLFES